VRAGEGVEERALAGVGVADERDGGHGDGFATLALLAAHAADGLEIELELVDSALDAAAIGFELGFAGSAGADAAAELRHGFAAAGEARQHVLELGELDLQLAFTRAGMAGEDVEDKLGAIENAARQGSFEVAQLRGREIVVEEDKVGVGGGGDAGDLFDLAGTDERGRFGLGAALQEFGSDLAAGADQQLAEFGERFLWREIGWLVGGAALNRSTSWNGANRGLLAGSGIGVRTHFRRRPAAPVVAVARAGAKVDTDEYSSL